MQTSHAPARSNPIRAHIGTLLSFSLIFLSTQIPILSTSPRLYHRCAGHTGPWFSHSNVRPCAARLRSPAVRLSGLPPHSAISYRVMRGVRWHDLARYQPVEQHADTGQILLDRGGRPLALQLFDIAADMHRLDAAEFADPLPFAPAEKHGGRAPVGRPRGFFSGCGGGEIDERA